MSWNFKDPKIRAAMFQGNFGLEKESLRVTPEGFLAHTSHPFPDNPNIERDFCENQTELITNVWTSADEVWEHLTALHKTTVKKLLHLDTGAEFLWPFSNPPYVQGETDIPIAHYQGVLKGKEQYREYLAEKYGKKKMLFSGIHFNFSFSEELLKAAYENSGVSSYTAYKNEIYLELAWKVTEFSWLIVYLTAASSVMDGSFFRDEDLGKDLAGTYSSARCSDIGYWNDFVPILDYKNLDSYVQSIQKYVEEGQLKEAAELYYPVRLKPAGENSLEHLQKNGVGHIELRTLDLNPYEPSGISREDLKFLHLLILYLMSLEDRSCESFEQIMAVKNEKKAAHYEEKGIGIGTGWSSETPIREAALEVLDRMEEFYGDFEDCEEGETYRDAEGKSPLELIRLQKKKLEKPENRYAVQVKQQFGSDYVKKGLALAKRYAEEMDREGLEDV